MVRPREWDRTGSVGLKTSTRRERRLHTDVASTASEGSKDLSTANPAVAMPFTAPPAASRPTSTRKWRQLLAIPGPGTTATTAVARRDAIYRRTLVTGDAVAAATALVFTNAVVGIEQPNRTTLAAVPLIVVLGKIIGLYDRQKSMVRKSTLDEAPVLFQLAMLYAVAIWLINGLLITRTNSRRELLVSWFVLFALLLLFRATARAVSRRATVPERCLIVGDEPTCERIRVKLGVRRALHACVVASVQIDMSASEHQRMGVLSDEGHLAALAAEHRVDRIIIAPARADGDEVLNVIRTASSLGVKVSIVPRLLEVVGSSVEFDEVEGIPLLSMRSVRLSRSSQLIKRALDVTASILGLVIVTPLLALIALAIKLDSGGSLLFRQRRVGRNGEVFEMLKFRTMIEGAEHQREGLRHLNEADGLFKIAADPRITRVGSALRRTSLDELPQLWNVLRGDMSLVGPRPLVAEEDERIQGWHRRRLQLTPGMTGHWQILGSARIPLHEMANIDYLYVTNWSLWNDVKILIRTVPYVVARRGI
jgi:exopolysaccharide biosynthesis polyprenyl glycosylphosphotransferase